MRKIVKMIGVIAGVLGLLSAVYLLIVFVSQVRYILEWNSDEMVRRYSRQYEVPVKVWLTTALALFSQFGLCVSLLRTKKDGMLATFLVLLVVSNVLAQDLTQMYEDAGELARLIGGAVLVILLALECGLAPEIPVVVKAIVLVGGMVAVEGAGFIGADIGAILSSPLDVMLSFTPFLSNVLMAVFVCSADKEYI